MDIRIKGRMDGTETAAILRERFNIPVIYLTGLTDQTTMAIAKIAEPLGYITKPFKRADLQRSIQIALTKRHSDTQAKAQGG
jgi:CheY-like chemotaxis protein